jgi:hypothetical protein
MRGCAREEDIPFRKRKRDCGSRVLGRTKILSCSGYRREPKEEFDL